MKQKNLLIAFGFCLIFTVFSSCGLFHKKQPAVVKPDLIIGYFPSSDMFPYYLAYTQGYLDSLQVIISFQRMESRQQCDTLYRAGKLDGCIFDLTDALRMSAHGNKIYPVMGNEGCFYLLGTPDSIILGYQLLKDKTLAVESYTASDYLADRIIRLAGLTNDDLGKPEIDNDYVRLDMLLNGQIDAGIFREPYSTQAVRGHALKLYSFNDMNEITTVTAFSRQALDKKADAIRKLITGYNLAVEHLNTRPVKEWYRAVADSIGFPQWEAPARLATFHKARPIPQSSVDSVAKWMKLYELIPQNYKGDIVDRTLINSLKQD